ncbi:hypothetical protein [Ornithinibacillus californiensis]|nr:hypothetical protein [Ornithinibacillus californiensis]
MLFFIGFVLIIFILLTIESHLKKGTKQNEEIIELLKEIKEKQ